MNEDRSIYIVTAMYHCAHRLLHVGVCAQKDVRMSHSRLNIQVDRPQRH